MAGKARGSEETGHQTFSGRRRGWHPPRGTPQSAMTRRAHNRDLDALAALGPLPEQASVSGPRLRLGCHPRAAPRPGLIGVISEKGKPAPLQATKAVGGGAYELLAQRPQEARVVHRASGTGHRLLDRFFRMIIIVRRLIREVWTRYRWETRPPRRPWPCWHKLAYLSSQTGSQNRNGFESRPIPR